jgi:hypothetical protein
LKKPQRRAASKRTSSAKPKQIPADLTQRLAQHPVAITVSVIALLSLLAAGLVFVANEKLAPLTSDQLRTAADEWRATSVSAQMLVEQWEAEKLTVAYFSNECQFLHDDATRNERSLRAAQPEEVLQAQYEQLVGVSDQITANLEQLCATFQDSAQRRQLNQQLQTLTDQL